MEDFTAAPLILIVREDANLGPSTDESFPTDAVILRYINEEMKNCLNPALMKPREERFVAIDRFTTTANVGEYDVPERSQWSDIRDVQVLIPGSSPEQWWSLNPIRPEQAGGWFGLWFATPNAQYPAGYYEQADQIVLWPPPPSAYVMRIKYFCRPGRIVASGYSTVTAIAGSGPTYTATVSDTTGMPASGPFDLDGINTPYRALLRDVVGVVASDTAVTLTLSAADAAVVTAALNGACLIAAGDAPGPQLPQDVIPLLTMRGTYRAMKQKGNPNWKDMLLSAEALEQKLIKAYTPRQDGLAQTAVVTNAPGMGGGWGGYGAWGW